MPATLDLRRGQVVGDASRRGINLNTVTKAVASATYAPIASPTFTGDPKAPTPAPGDNDTSVATTAFVKNQGYATTVQLTGYLPLSGGVLSGTLTVNQEVFSTGANAAYSFANRSGSDTWLWYADTNAYLYSTAHGGAALTVTPAGNVGIGTVGPGAKLEVDGGNDPILMTASNGVHARLQCVVTGTRQWSMGAASTGAFWITDESAVSQRITIDTAGNCKNITGTWAAISDPRTKTGMVPWNEGLQAVLALNPITFRYNGLGGTPDDGTLHLGLDASEVQAVLPDLVLTSEAGGLLSVDLGKLVFPLINAVKELAARIEALEAAR